MFLTGRRSLLGYPGWTWSRGLDDAQRQADIKRIYSGEADAVSLLQSYHVDYVLVGPEELSSLNVNLPFWSRFPQVAKAGPDHLFKITTQEVRFEK